MLFFIFKAHGSMIVYLSSTLLATLPSVLNERFLAMNQRLKEGLSYVNIYVAGVPNNREVVNR